MTEFFSSKYASLEPYVPGEQPKDKKFVKLNTNENPFPPSPLAVKMGKEAEEHLELYSDPDCLSIRRAAAPVFGVDEDEIIFTNGSDEALNFAFMAFCDSSHPAVFADITYGFYPVFAKVNGIPFEEIPLNNDFSINVEDYIGINKTVFIANPNAPTGQIISNEDIARIAESNPHNVVVIDEAYIDFGNESCIPLIRRYNNLLVTGTFSKSRSMAGARLGFAIGCKGLIADLNTIRNSTNPYNINSSTMAMGVGSLMSEDYTKKNCREIVETREFFTAELRKLGFELADSHTNFVFAHTSSIPGGELYSALREKGFLVRHFTKERIDDYLRITIGSREQMTMLLAAIREILEERK